MHKHVILAAVSIATGGVVAGAIAQTAPVNGIRPAEVRTHAIVGATVVIAPGRRLVNATVIVRDGVIEAVGTDIPVPAGAREWPGDDLTVYPGLIDSGVLVDFAGPDPGRGGAHWNPHIHPQVRVSDRASIDADGRKALRELGFAVAAVYPSSGVLRGSGAVIALADSDEHVLAYRNPAAMGAGFDRSHDRTYPNSLMGSIALMRQTLYDAQWHAQCRRLWADDPTGREPPIRADALAALDGVVAARQPVLFDVADEHAALRAARIADEFGLDAVLLGSGYEFRRLDAIAATGLPVIVPLEYPERPDVSKLSEADDVTLRRMMTWEQAPTNPRRLVDAGVTVALTTHRLEKRSSFHAALHKAIRHGLDEDDALAALTTTPARLLGLDHVLGTIEPGKAANLVVVDGSLFERKPTIRSTWINGRRYEVTPEPAVKFAATGTLSTSMGIDLPVTVDTTEPKVSAETPDGKKTEASKVFFQHDRLVFVMDGAPFETDGHLRFSGLLLDGRIVGRGTLPDGDPFTFSITRDPEAAQDAAEESDEADEDTFEPPPQELVYPLGAFGLAEPPRRQDVLLTNAVIWTCGPEGIIDNGSMLVRDGRIAAVGRGPIAAPAGVAVLDLGGRHLTPGLIDCHSHTGISGGANEGSQAVTAEVRIADVINPDDINFYRELAGGLTVANQLHGSANPIGGQNSVNKFRWSAAADGYPMPQAPGGIKFALGENVKRRESRYPNTRMGVDAIIRDALTAARVYRERRLAYLSMSNGERDRTMPPRRDLELDALVEVLEGQRLVHCHSYRQDEILMLIRLAEEFGFTVGTFQHVLEGYKVAEAIAAHGAGASTFSDWWAYKIEVMDAIPFNGALMHDVGVLVSFNSDSSELARRMNTEVAKAVRYGGIDPAEALGFVTINPARQLGVAEHIGSLEAGKHADFAIWSESPLSTYARCEQTWIEGARYFDLDQDRHMRATARAERRRLIRKILDEDGRKAKDESDHGSGGAEETAEPGYSCCWRHDR